MEPTSIILVLCERKPPVTSVFSWQGTNNGQLWCFLLISLTKSPVTGDFRRHYANVTRYAPILSALWWIRHAISRCRAISCPLAVKFEKGDGYKLYHRPVCGYRHYITYMHNTRFSVLLNTEKNHLLIKVNERKMLFMFINNHQQYEKLWCEYVNNLAYRHQFAVCNVAYMLFSSKSSVSLFSHFLSHAFLTVMTQKRHGVNHQQLNNLSIVCWSGPKYHQSSKLVFLCDGESISDWWIYVWKGQYCE